jgi:hypothetical protein
MGYSLPDSARDADILGEGRQSPDERQERGAELSRFRGCNRLAISLSFPAPAGGVDPMPIKTVPEAEEVNQNALRPRFRQYKLN